VANKWPQKVTVVSHEFKRKRFLDLHVKAIRWPEERVVFVGIDPEYMAEDEARGDAVRKGETERGYKQWESDMGGWNEFLRGKRRDRNPWGIGQGLFADEDAGVGQKAGLKSTVHEDGEELSTEWQPWEEDAGEAYLRIEKY